MLEIVLFTLVGIALYIISSQVLVFLEKLHGNPLPQRNIIFFVVILALSLPSFSLMRSFLGEGESPQNDNQEQQATDGGDEPTQPH